MCEKRNFKVDYVVDMGDDCFYIRDLEFDSASDELIAKAIGLELEQYKKIAVKQFKGYIDLDDRELYFMDKKDANRFCQFCEETYNRKGE